MRARTCRNICGKLKCQCGRRSALPVEWVLRDVPSPWLQHAHHETIDPVNETIVCCLRQCPDKFMRHDSSSSLERCRFGVYVANELFLILHHRSCSSTRGLHSIVGGTISTHHMERCRFGVYVANELFQILHHRSCSSTRGLHSIVGNAANAPSSALFGLLCVPAFQRTQHSAHARAGSGAARLAEQACS